MKKREQIYTFLIDFIKEKGYQPTVREIAHAVNLKSSSSVYRHLEMLEKDGLIILGKSEQRGRKRSIHIIDLNKKIKENVSEETIKNLIKFSKKQVNTDNDVFSKKVTNDYIVTVDNIFPDDIIIEKVNSLEKDSIGLLLFENRIFIERIFSDYEKVYDTDPTVLGKVIGVYRDFF
ncbi:transcriptional regulator (plasmid) [Clostridium perfringens]|uniref:LexA family protein n=1 Tax=Clostridium perfringens TaxID=1502 RepID=UPI0010D6DAD8|nr:transcriptional regulator [Clostridium perfringens]ELC8371308.1 transcriptional regulator [Clostridium perfringens]MCX0358472.1 transcriptional regulator [Clostridium perfringens]MCX0365695.1 transcriptional regulator [Clostridium perfringens]MCX0386546.1 transcriptional regulator [Clostridium perfringens]MCX0407524.1 transcriptional regulator [Clostridium perfringens]